jgi:lipid-A-disaccharide synthase
MTEPATGLRTLYVIAGEPSGDRLGGALIAGLRDLAPDTRIIGIGGPRMADQGLTSRMPMDELTVMGLAEILPKYRSLMRRIDETARDVVREAPAALVTIDLPEFGLRVASRVRAANPGIRTIHYVAPSVWAWRPGRAAKMARHVDHVLALLPFEPPYMTAAGMGCDFVGHPVVAEPVATPDQAAAFSAVHGLDGGPVVVVLPGSRGGEVKRLLPVFGPALQALAARHPGLRVVVPLAAPVADTVTAAAKGWPGRPVLLDPRGTAPEAAEQEKRAAFAAADIALAASGTVSLELAAQGCPMVVAYDFAPLTWFLMKRMVRVDTVTLVNLVSETRTVPEYLGPDCRPAPIADALHRLLTDPAARAAQKAAMATTMQRLGQGDDPPGLRAARAVLRVASGGQVAR